MNFPGVIAGDPAELEKLALEGAAHVDGHAPGVLGKALNAYAASGIRSDHEALTVEEGRQRLRAGMWLLIREASMARNLVALLPLVEEYGTERMAFCTDDRDPEDIADSGHINQMVRTAVASGIAPRGRNCARVPQRRHLARAGSPRRDRTGVSGRSRCPGRPRVVRPPARAQGGKAGGGDPGGGGARLGDAHRQGPADLRRRLPHSVGGCQGPRDRVDPRSGRHGGARSSSRASRTVRSSPTRRRTSRRSP